VRPLLLAFRRSYARLWHRRSRSTPEHQHLTYAKGAVA
jgi:hypothetical protein